MLRRDRRRHSALKTIDEVFKFQLVRVVAGGTLRHGYAGAWSIASGERRAKRHPGRLIAVVLQKPRVACDLQRHFESARIRPSTLNLPDHPALKTQGDERVV